MSPPEIDMSPHAVGFRLREWSLLWILFQELRSAGDMGPVAKPPKESGPDASPEPLLETGPLPKDR